MKKILRRKAQIVKPGKSKFGSRASCFMLSAFGLVAMAIVPMAIVPMVIGTAYHEPVEKKDKASANFVLLSHGVKEKYVIDKKESVVTWKGSRLLAANQAHTGYVYVSKGELTIKKGQLVDGTVEVDMNTIEDKDHGTKITLSVT